MLKEAEVMNKPLKKVSSAGMPKMSQTITLTIISTLFLLGVSACSTTTPETPQNAIVAVATPTNTLPPPKLPVALPNGKVPNSLVDAGEYGENIYDTAKANNWTKVAAKLASLKN